MEWGLGGRSSGLTSRQFMSQLFNYLTSHSACRYLYLKDVFSMTSTVCQLTCSWTQLVPHLPDSFFAIDHSLNFCSMAAYLLLTTVCTSPVLTILALFEILYLTILATYSLYLISLTAYLLFTTASPFQCGSWLALYHSLYLTSLAAYLFFPKACTSLERQLTCSFLKLVPHLKGNLLVLSKSLYLIRKAAYLSFSKACTSPERQLTCSFQKLVLERQLTCSFLKRVPP